MSYKGDTFIITSIIVTAGQADANLEESAEALRDAACAIFSTEDVAKDFIAAVTDLVRDGRLDAVLECAGHAVVLSSSTRPARLRSLVRALWVSDLTVPSAQRIWAAVSATLICS